MKKLSTILEDAKKKNTPKGLSPGSRGTQAPNIIVNALAGSGKTFTLIVGIAMVFIHHIGAAVKKGLGFDPKPSDQQAKVWELIAASPFRSVTYIAFNRTIVKEFDAKWKWLVRALDTLGVLVKFSTIHSMAYGVCLKAYGRLKVNKWNCRNLLEEYLGKDLREVMKDEKGRSLVYAIDELVRMVKLTLTHEEDGDGVLVASDEALDKLSVHYAILLNGNREEIFKAVNALLNKARNPDNGCIDFNDQIWLPVVNDLPVFQVDLLLVDEGQDLNRCQQALALKAGKRIVLVGDVNQAIYGFAGADVDSIPRMRDLLGERPNGVVEVPLTVTRRCGKAIVREAQQLVPGFEAHESNPDGIVRRMEADKQGKWKEALTDKDFVLCRTNAPLIGLAFSLIREGRKANIQGRDIGAGMKALIKKSSKREVDDFLDWLQAFHDKEAQRINKAKNPNEEALTALADRIECLRIFCEGALSLADVNKNIDKVFQGRVCPKCNKSFGDEIAECYGCKVPTVRPDGVLLSSIHRAKGLEADRVFILRPDLLPHPMAKTEWGKGQERNLEYVAITRAIHELVWIDGETDEDR